MTEAAKGLHFLGREIDKFLQAPSQGKASECHIFVESGTGSTALFLHQYFRQQNIAIARDPCLAQSNVDGRACLDIKVKAVSCVIPPTELHANMRLILESSDGSSMYDSTEDDLPEVLHSASSSGKEIKPFGTPCLTHLAIWRELKATTGILFDLLYAPRAFEQIFQLWTEEEARQVGRSDNAEIAYIYIHSGGVEGNKSQFDRYKYLKLIDRSEPFAM